MFGPSIPSANRLSWRPLRFGGANPTGKGRGSGVCVADRDPWAAGVERFIRDFEGIPNGFKDVSLNDVCVFFPAGFG